MSRQEKPTDRENLRKMGSERSRRVRLPVLRLNSCKYRIRWPFDGV